MKLLCLRLLVECYSQEPDALEMLPTLPNDLQSSIDAASVMAQHPQLAAQLATVSSGFMVMHKGGEV